MTKPLSILVPAGIGDAAWAFLKLPPWLKSRGETRADVWVYQELPDRARSHDFIDLVPFARFAGYWDAKAKPMRHGAWSNIRRQPGRMIFTAADGFDKPTPFDYIVYPNSALENGYDLTTDVLPWLPPAWDYEIRRGPFANAGDALPLVAARPFVLVYVTLDMIYTKAFTPETFTKWAANLRALYDTLPSSTLFLLTGSKWDIPANATFAKALEKAGVPFANVAGQTTFHQFIALVEDATLFVGLPGGNTILSVMLRKPTVILWPAGMWANTRFRHVWAQPGWQRWYAPIEAWPQDPAFFVDAARSVLP